MQGLWSFVYPKIRNMDVANIESENVPEDLKLLWKTKHETATGVRQRTEAVLDAAAAGGCAPGRQRCRSIPAEAAASKRMLGHAIERLDIPNGVALLI